MKILLSCLAIAVPRAVLGSHEPTDELSNCLLFISQRAKCDAASSAITNVPKLLRCSSHHQILEASLRKSCEEAEKSCDKSEKSRIHKLLHNMLGDEAAGMESLKTKFSKELDRIRSVANACELLANNLKAGNLKDDFQKKSTNLKEALVIAEQAREKVDQENKDCLKISADEFYDVVQQMRKCKRLYVKAKSDPEFIKFQEKCAANDDLKEYLARNNASQVMFTEFLNKAKAEYHNEDNVGVRVCALKALHDKCGEIQGAWKAKIAEMASKFGEGVKCESGPLKKMDRCQAKFFYKYHGNGKGLSDINRASIILPSVDGIIDAVNEVDKFFAENGGILRMKNRFMKAKDAHLDAGYSDILLNVKFEGIICEVQIHLQSLVNIKKGINEFGVKDLSMKGHAVYKVARRFSHFFLAVCFEDFDANVKADDGTEDALDEAVAALRKPSLSRHSSFKDIAEVKEAFANLGMKKPERRRLMDRLACAEAYSC